MAKANAQVEIGAGTSRLASGLRTAYSQFVSFGGQVARGIGAALKKIDWKPGDTMKSALGHAGGDLIGKGIGAVTDAADEVRGFERSLVRYQIASNGTAAATSRFRDQINGVSKETGIARSEILAGASSYVALTGDAAGATAAVSAFARIAQASGASVADVATAQAALNQALGVTGGETEAAFSGLIAQGKAGAVEIKDFAGELATLAPQFATFGKKGVGGLRDMGAAFQVIRQGAGSAGEAATQFQAMMGELVSSHKDLKKIGVDVFHKNPKTGKRELRDFVSIADDLAKNKALGDPAKMAKIFGRKESQAAIRTIREQIGALHALQKTGEDTGAVQRDLNTFLESDAGRLDKAFNEMKLAIAQAFTPERIGAFTNAVIELADRIQPVVDAVGFMADKLGGIYDVGRKVRGLIAGDHATNPFGGSFADEQRDRQTAFGDGTWIATADGRHLRRDSREGQIQVGVARRRIEQRSGYNDAVAQILGSERNERSTKESLNAAAQAFYSGNLGTSEAGRRYLVSAGLGNTQTGAVDRDKIDAMVRESLKAAGAEMGAGIRDALAGLKFPDLQIGDNQVAKSADKSTAARRGTR